MAICSYCDKEMTDRNTIKCTGNGGLQDKTGTFHDPVPYEGKERCHDCNVKDGELHHPVCDMELCPKCKAQLISCDCFDFSAELITSCSCLELQCDDNLCKCCDCGDCNCCN